MNHRIEIKNKIHKTYYPLKIIFTCRNVIQNPPFDASNAEGNKKEMLLVLINRHAIDKKEKYQTTTRKLSLFFEIV